MEKNLEIEYKMLLSEALFNQLMNDFKGHTYSQTNYYRDFDSCRASDLKKR